MVDVEQLAKDGKLFDGRYKLLKTLSTDGSPLQFWERMVFLEKSREAARMW